MTVPPSLSPRRSALPAVLWTLAIWAVCSVPGGYVPEVRLVSADKLVHAAFFAVWGWLWMRRFPRHRGRVVLGGLAFAGFIEAWQHWMPLGRFADAGDAAADALGLGLAWLAADAARRRGNSRAAAVS